MRLIFTLILLLAGAVAAAHAGELQAGPLPRTPREVPLPPAADNKAMGCRDFRNRPVRTVEVPALGDAGRAEFIEGMPIIMLDPALLGTLPANLQLFFKLHECGHHMLGHLFAPNNESEKEADCWAIQEGRKRSAFTREEIFGWRTHFADSRGSKTGHLPGPERVTFLLGCWDRP
jgi:hypothetical protein